MDFINWTVILLASIAPMLIGFIWYHPKFFGTAWMNACGLNEEKLKGANMAKIFTLSFIFSIMIALSLQFVVIHQFHVYSIFASDTSTEAQDYLKGFMEKYGNNFRTFKHGALHGTITGIFLIFPLIATNALFERKSFKYIFINAGYWIVSFAIMGGIICAYA